MNRGILLVVGARIRQFRKMKNLSQEELAFMTGLHRTYIGSCERGERNIAILNLAKICKALDISLWEFFRAID